MKIEEFIKIWVRNYGKKNLAPKTLFRYKQLSERINTAIGHIQLGKLKPNHLLQFYQNLQEPGIREDTNKDKGLSERTILHYHRLLNTIMETAVQWQYIAVNPVSRVKAPKVRAKQAICYDADHVAAMLDALQDELLIYQVAVWITLAAGLRQGELMGLRWQNVDLEKNSIYIAQVRQRVNCQDIVKEPKTNKSKRLLSIPTIVVKLIKTYKKCQLENKLLLANKYHESSYLLTWEDGTPLYAESMSGWFPQFLKRHKLPHMNFHGLRHTSATLLIADGLNVIDVSRRLGHARTSTTLDIYSHSFQKADEIAAQKMDTILTNATHKKA